MFTIAHPNEMCLWVKVRQPVIACPYLKKKASQNQDALPGTTRDDSDELDLRENAC